MDPVTLRIFIYDWLLAHGIPPRVNQIAHNFKVTEAQARDAVLNLKIGKTVLAHPGRGEIWMAGPFASTPTPYKVTGTATWYANCAWDMLGIPIIANRTCRIETKCTDCDERIEFDAGPHHAPQLQALVHFLVPAKRWYDDIGFT